MNTAAACLISLAQYRTEFLENNPNYLDGIRSHIDKLAREASPGATATAGAAVGGGAGLAVGGPVGAAVGGAIGGAAGGALGFLAPWFESDSGKEYATSWAAFVGAALRKDTGAAISKEEWATAFREWIPAPGDNPETIRLKAKTVPPCVAMWK